jgi:mannosyltransferase OCH1-like enzyme
MAYKKIIHRYWSGPSEMPEAYKRYGEKWEDLNPGWVVIDHGEEIIQLWPDLFDVFNHLYERDAGRDSIELHVQLADVVGYALLREFGGVYVNCDMEPVRSFDYALPDCAWASFENHEDWRIVNAAIGAPQANNPFWEELLRELPHRYFNNPYDEMVMTTGPGFLTDFAALNSLLEKTPFWVFSKDVFNSVHWKQIEEGGDASGFEYPEIAIAVHHWGHKKDRRTNVIEGNTQHVSS